MSIDFGTERTSIKIYRNGETARTLKHYKIRTKVTNSQEEMTEFIRFTSEVGKHRDDNTLAVERDDPSTRPSFVLEYPKENIDGSYFVIKCWTIEV